MERGWNPVNVRKNIDYSAMFAALDTLTEANLPQMEMYFEIGRLVSNRQEKGAAIAAAEYLQAMFPEASGFSPRSLRRMREFYRAYADAPEMMNEAMTLGWTQNIVILEAGLTMQERLWYIRAALRFGWSKSVLVQKITAAAHLELDLAEEMCYTEENDSAGNVTDPVETAELQNTRIESSGIHTGALLVCIRRRSICGNRGWNWFTGKTPAQFFMEGQEHKVLIRFLKTRGNSDILKSSFLCSRDGLAIRGTEYRPAGSNLPAAIVSHGFMANQSTVRHYTRYLAKAGYAAYCFDFNGGSVMGSKSDGKTTDMSVLTEVMDLEAVIDHVLRLPYIDRSKGVLLMGCSQGGFVSALTATKRKTQVSHLVLLYPAFCIPDDACAGKMMFARFDPRNVPERVNCGPMKLGRCYVTDVLDMDPFAAIIPYPGPVLIVHGTNDRIVHPDYAQRAFEAYSERHVSEASVSLEMIEGGGHGFSKRHDALAMTKLSRFLQSQV